MIHHRLRSAYKTTALPTVYNNTYSSTAASTTYSFASCSIGTADADRVVIVTVMASKTSADRTFNSITIGGNAATILSNARRNGTNDHIAGIAALLVTTGTTATVAVTFSAAMDGCDIAVYSHYPVNGASYTYNQNTSVGLNAANTSVSLDIIAGGAIFAVGISSDGFDAAPWSGTAGVSVSDTGNITVVAAVSDGSSASKFNASGGTAQTVVADFVGTASAFAVAVVSMSP